MSTFKTVFFATRAGDELRTEIEETLAVDVPGVLAALPAVGDGRYDVWEQLLLCHDHGGHEVKEETHHGIAAVEDGVVSHDPDREWRD